MTSSAHTSNAHPTTQMTRRIRSANDDAAREDGGMVLMIVIVTCAGYWQRRGLTALSRREETDRINFAAIGRRRVGPPRDVVRLAVVVDERHPLAGRDDQLPWISARL